MARFLIYGAMSWDRTIRLRAPLKSGGRLSGIVENVRRTELVGGHLGGGGANAASALINAGHDAAVYAPIPEGPEGQDIWESGDALGIDMRFAQRVPAAKTATLVLIEPDGERVVLHLQPEDQTRSQAWRDARNAMAPPGLDALESFDPVGLYLRAPLPGYDVTERLANTIILAHWPFGQGLPVVCDGLIGSRDDLADLIDTHAVFDKARKTSGDRLKWVIVTDGAKGGVIYTQEREISYAGSPVDQVDATGAGDTFAAGVLDALTSGADIVEATRHGAAWGAITAGFLGATRPRPKGSYRAWASAD